MQTAPRPDGINSSCLVILIPRATILDPDGMPDPFLAVVVERIGHILFGCDGADVFGLEFADQLERVVGDVHEGTHDGAVFDGPGGSDEGEEVGEAGDCEAKVAWQSQ